MKRDIEEIKKRIAIEKERTKPIREIAELKDGTAIPKLINLLLDKATDFGFKNAIAICLRDLNADEAVGPLMQEIKNPANENQRGTLIYALKNLNCSEYFLDFIEIICTGNFECRMTCRLFLIEKNLDKVSSLVLQEALNILSVFRLKYELVIYDPNKFNNVDLQDVIGQIEFTHDLISAHQVR